MLPLILQKCLCVIICMRVDFRILYSWTLQHCLLIVHLLLRNGFLMTNISYKALSNHFIQYNVIYKCCINVLFRFSFIMFKGTVHLHLKFSGLIQICSYTFEKMSKYEHDQPHIKCSSSKHWLMNYDWSDQARHRPDTSEIWCDLIQAVCIYYVYITM